ncbi:hypothetical protein ACFT2C_13545 [Promicromonospora sp. NPDC057138]|uniref:hypothetical protein n=1 Tax=Promicromonospora sp. NPDC057138 TaxID=3346031 RepID=UPI003640B31D
MPVPRHASRNLLLRPSFEPPQVRALAEDSGWRYAGQIDEDPERGIFFEARWDTADGGTVHYIVDDVADAAYLVARHDDPLIAEQVADRIVAALPVWTPEALLEVCYVKVYPAGWAKALKQLGLGAPKQADEQMVDHIKFSSEHQDAPVRMAAVWAMVYTEWPVFRDVLAGMAEKDPDPEVTARAARAVQELDRAASSAS